MRSFVILALLCLTATAAVWAQDSLLDQARARFEVVPASPPAIVGNPLTPEKIELGKMLFFDPRLSRSWLISCNTCHNVATGGVDLLETSIGHGWAKGPRNSPTVLNAVFNGDQFWDGRAKDLQEQAKGPVQAGVEMNSTPERVVETLKSMPGYIEAFETSFPGQPDPVNFDNMAYAIEAFESTLLTPWSAFDRYLSGEPNALNSEELRGLGLFLSKGCANCHSGINMGGTGHFTFGVAEKPADEILPEGDKGRFQVTMAASDEYSFKSPSLRNIDLTAPYFHSGKVWNLREAVEIMGTSQLGAGLNDAEVDAITAFLRTLTGEQPRIEYPVLPPHTDRTPLPESGPTYGGDH